MKDCRIAFFLIFLATTVCSLGVDSGEPSLDEHIQALHKLDDQQCIPRLLCELAATANRETQTPQEKYILQLLSMNSSDVTVKGDPRAIYSSAAQLGFETRNSSACVSKYITCPITRDQLVSIFSLISSPANVTTTEQ